MPAKAKTSAPQLPIAIIKQFAESLKTTPTKKAYRYRYAFLHSEFSSGGALYNFYMAVSQLPPFSRVGYYEGGAFVEGEAALARAITELVPPFLRPLAELFASYRIY